MKWYLACLCAATLWLAGGPCFPRDVFPTEDWERVRPEEAGFDADRFKAATRATASLNSIGGLVAWNGRIVLAWGDIAAKGKLHSVRKSLLSALYGTAVARGEIDPDRTLAELGIDDTGGLTGREKQARVRHLLMARSSVYHEAAYETDAMKAARPSRGSHDPDDFWYYNNWDFNTLGTILEQSAGESVGRLFLERLATPLGMQDFTVGDVRSHFEPVSLHPAALFRMTARDMARFGLLYMHRGQWNGRRVVPEAWVDESLRPHSQGRPRAAYGYLWWIGKDKALGGRFDCSAFWASGHGGQAIVVIPGEKLVITHLSRYDANRIDSFPQFWAFIDLLLASRTGPCRDEQPSTPPVTDASRPHRNP